MGENELLEDAGEENVGKKEKGKEGKKEEGKEEVEMEEDGKGYCLVVWLQLHWRCIQLSNLQQS